MAEQRSISTTSYRYLQHNLYSPYPLAIGCSCKHFGLIWSVSPFTWTRINFKVLMNILVSNHEYAWQPRYTRENWTRSSDQRRYYLSLVWKLWSHKLQASQRRYYGSTISHWSWRRPRPKLGYYKFANGRRVLEHTEVWCWWRTHRRRMVSTNLVEFLLVDQWNLTKAPAFYKLELVVTTDNLKDTFLNMENWTKGVVWVNGINLGRYWAEEGPATTLYLPGSFYFLSIKSCLCFL